MVFMNRYFIITTSTYGTLRSLYYSNNIKIEEKLSDNRSVYRKLLLSEHIASMIFSIPIGILYTPFLIINDIEYIERRKICLSTVKHLFLYL